MIAPRNIAVIGLLPASVQAGPCKPSSTVTITTETTATDAASTTGTATSAEIPTTETTLLPSSTGYTCVNNEKTPFPAGVLCDTKGIGADPNMVFLTELSGDVTIAKCRDVCRGLDGCIAFAIQPGVYCDLWGGRVQGTDGSNTDFTWYSLECFCDLPELPTTSAEATATTATTGTTAITTDTATTELEASSTVLTTSSAELASTTETTTAAATSTTAALGCPGGFPADHSCGVFKQYSGGGQNYIKDYSGAYSVEECMQFCIDDDTCTLINHSSYFCELWTGDLITNGLSAAWSWYELAPAD
ncbi:uncharacterized protein FTJAE_4104 [Fusarium tjaetaba]|uniref:Apple domain-containing protein n=1 Tax=Fusarium tjaetaba TaxID=1567544 RepID=A0A8H5RZS2_9HYPO|nr:uncharacterized protein FTJAE_4104 [Fusarium tjaetaba]KAF5641452.1 hypothetical protein FTJAE_4104 [Fusarium tjaetaba]